MFDSVDIMPLVFFRVAFGGIMLWEVWRYFYYDRVFRYYIEPTFYFHYTGFGWIAPLPGVWMVWLWCLLGALAILIMIGAYYRLSMTIFWLLFTYCFLIDQTQYLNHFYLVSLMSFLAIFMPLHHKWSWDAWRGRVQTKEHVPAWSLRTIQAQMAIVYVYGGIAKINPDWLLGEPMRDWLAERTDFPLIGHLFTQEWMVHLFSYGGLFFDLLIVPIILWHRTRWLGVVLMAGFHMTNYELFNIGIFPLLAFTTTLLFLPSSWFRFWENTTPADEPRKANLQQHRMLLLGLGVFFAAQLLLPVRHFAYPGYASWTEEGHNLAWHMKLRSKGGNIYFYATHPETSVTRQVDLTRYLNNRQIAQMSDNPDMISRFASYLSTLDDYENHQIRVWSMMSLNGRASQLLIDPTVDLAMQSTDLWRDDWIVPLIQPPAPLNADGVPALLVSHQADGLVFINITRQPFPLENLQVTLDDQQLFTTWQTSDLYEDDCSHRSFVTLTEAPPSMICNDVGIAPAMTISVNESEMSSLAVNAPYAIDCRPTYCIVTYHAP